MKKNEQVHIVHIFSTFSVGGPQLRMASIINAVGPAWRHTILALDNQFDAAARIQNDTRVDFVRPPDRGGAYPYALRLRGVVAGLGPDVLITYNWGAIEAIAGALVGRLCPILHHEHGFGPDEAFQLKYRRVFARRILLNRIWRTIVPSKTLYDIASKQYRVGSGLLRLIPNGVDVEKFRPDSNGELRRALGVFGNGLLFGYVGQLRREKNLDFLITAFRLADLPQAKLILVGSGPCRSELDSLVQNLELSDRVLFVEETDKPASYYAALDVFVMASVTEQMPMSLLEAMAVGLPAICTRVGDISEMLGHSGPPSVVDVGDIEQYAIALRTVGQNRDLRLLLGEENRRRCTEQYSLRKMIEGYQEEFNAAATRERTRVDTEFQ